MTTTNSRVDPVRVDTHNVPVDPAQSSLRANGNTNPKNGLPAGGSFPADQTMTAAHRRNVGGDQTSSGGHKVRDAQRDTAAAGTQTSPPANVCTEPNTSSPVGNQTGNGPAATKIGSMPINDALLADPFLALAADVLDDAERTKIANQNRLRQMTRTAVDADGEERGFGLDESHPDVARLAALVEMLTQVEHQAVLQLQRMMRKHPLGPWAKAQKGVGEKQVARLLAVIGDPYWNSLHNRPRTVSELWAYCGLHTRPTGHVDTATQPSSAGGDSSDLVRVAARRQKGVKANWSTIAKTRAYLISESMLRAGNREVYDRRKAATEGYDHTSPCARCGPKGHPALPGSPWNDGHRHADALRIQSKEFLKELWIEARRIHSEREGDTA